VAKVPINDPKHWRKRVEEARTLAHKITDKKGKARMLRLAKQYEKLAEKADRCSKVSYVAPLSDDIDLK
jgi:hypothetical protein